MSHRAHTGTAFRVSGRVQGVGFRWFGSRLAEEIGIGGWIRNRSDGDVEGEAYGDPEALEQFIARLGQGPPSGRVDRLQQTAIQVDEAPTRFEIRY